MRIALVTLLFLLLFNSCSNENSCENSDSPKHLIGDFYSYQSIDDFKLQFAEFLNSSSIEKVLDVSTIEHEVDVPEFVHTTINIPEFLLFEFNGKLSATFYNNRLMTISFEMQDLQDFQTFLEKYSDLDYEKDHSIVKDCVNQHLFYFDNIPMCWTDFTLQLEEQKFTREFGTLPN